MTADSYNAAQLASGALTPTHVTELVRAWQASHGLVADGMAGPKTIATLGPAGMTISGHWLGGTGVAAIPAHVSWYGAKLLGGAPRGIVAHYTATDPGTGTNMARRRVAARTPEDRAASWHITIEADGSVIQMVPLDHVAWHAGSDTAKPIPNLGQANYSTVGIELVGHGDVFPPAQVESAKRVWRTLVRHYGIAHAYAMLEHSAIDPTRRNDPGPVWMRQHATDVLDAAHG
jgi:N-acetylmuramoyl-L-alanine amidase